MNAMSTRYYGNLGALEGESHSRLWGGSGCREKYMALGDIARFDKGALIAEAGKPAEWCYYILSGSVMAFEYMAASGERYYNFNEEGSLVMDANVILQKAPPVSFVALTAVEAVRIGRERLMQALREDPDLTMHVMSNLSFKFLAAMDQVREATQCSVAWKACNLLLTFAERYGVPYDGKILIKEKISQQIMANLLGVNRITMVRAIKELRELGMIEQVNGFYCIRDKEKMRAFMQEANIPREG